MTENVADYRPLAAQALRENQSHFGLVFTLNRLFPRGDPRTVGRLVTALDDLLSTDPDLERQEIWLT